jgi:hypothetical protein
VQQAATELVLCGLLQVRKLAKSEDAAVAAAATDVVEAWKTSVKREQATPDSNSLKRASAGLPVKHACRPTWRLVGTLSRLHALECCRERRIIDVLQVLRAWVLRA